MSDLDRVRDAIVLALKAQGGVCHSGTGLDGVDVNGVDIADCTLLAQAALDAMGDEVI